MLELHGEKQHPGGLKHCKYHGGKASVPGKREKAAEKGADGLSVLGRHAAGAHHAGATRPAVPGERGWERGEPGIPPRPGTPSLWAKAWEGRLLCWDPSWAARIVTPAFEARLPW